MLMPLFDNLVTTFLKRWLARKSNEKMRCCFHLERKPPQKKPREIKKRTLVLLFCRVSSDIRHGEKCKQCITEKLWTSASVPSEQSQWKKESHILAEHSISLKGKMSFIFKLLKCPFPFDCSLKLLCISLAQQADSPLNRTILQTISFLGILN